MAKEKKTVRIAGQKILRVWTLGSWYDNQCVGVAYLDTKGQTRTGRIPACEIAKMVNEFIFDVELAEHDKRKKYDYLGNPELIPENEEERSELVKQGLF